MKTLDSVIMRMLANGEKHSVSSKCAEMDREVRCIDVITGTCTCCTGTRDGLGGFVVSSG